MERWADADMELHSGAPPPAECGAVWAQVYGPPGVRGLKWRRVVLAERAAARDEARAAHALEPGDVVVGAAAAGVTPLFGGVVAAAMLRGEPVWCEISRAPPGGPPTPTKSPAGRLRIADAAAVAHADFEAAALAGCEALAAVAAPAPAAVAAAGSGLVPGLASPPAVVEREARERAARAAAAQQLLRVMGLVVLPPSVPRGPPGLGVVYERGGGSVLADFLRARLVRGPSLMVGEALGLCEAVARACGAAQRLGHGLAGIDAASFVVFPPPSAAADSPWRVKIATAGREWGVPARDGDAPARLGDVHLARQSPEAIKAAQFDDPANDVYVVGTVLADVLTYGTLAPPRPPPGAPAQTAKDAADAVTSDGDRWYGATPPGVPQPVWEGVVLPCGAPRARRPPCAEVVARVEGVRRTLARGDAATRGSRLVVELGRPAIPAGVAEMVPDDAPAVSSSAAAPARAGGDDVAVAAAMRALARRLGWRGRLACAASKRLAAHERTGLVEATLAVLDTFA